MCRVAALLFRSSLITNDEMPIFRAPTAFPRALLPSSERRPPIKKPTILLVEDHETRAEQIRASLPQTVHCVWAKTPGVAIGILKRDRFSGIFLDYSFRKEPSEGRELMG